MHTYTYLDKNRNQSLRSRSRRHRRCYDVTLAFVVRKRRETESGWERERERGKISRSRDIYIGIKTKVIRDERGGKKVTEFPKFTLIDHQSLKIHFCNLDRPFFHIKSQSKYGSDIFSYQT